MLFLEKLTKDKESEWDSFIKTLQDGQFEHKTAFIEFLSKNMKNMKNYFILKNKEIVGIVSLQKEKISFFTRYSSQGLLLKKGINKDGVITLLKKNLKGSYIRLNDLKQNTQPNKITPLTFILDTKNKDIQKIFNSELESRARRAIKKSIRAGLKIKISNSEEELTNFYPIYSKRMKAFGTIPNTLESLKELIKNKEYKIFNVYLKNKLIAGGTMIINKNMITNHLAASDKKYLQHSPNNFLYYHMIEYAKKHKLDLVNYGPSLKTDKVAKFKESMGGEPTSFEQHIILNKLAYKLFNLFSFTLLKLKNII
jgi:lipid II:glycine glycyltransferase (peptidoglycan interpeptide bridge formation enzyme)